MALLKVPSFLSSILDSMLPIPKALLMCEVQLVFLCELHGLPSQVMFVLLLLQKPGHPRVQEMHLREAQCPISLPPVQPCRFIDINLYH